MSAKPSFSIAGLNCKSLKGSISVNGAKNAALKAMAAAVLFDSPVTLENMPDTADIGTLSSVLEKLGAKVSGKGTHTITIDPTTINSTVIDTDLAATMRASVVLTGPLLARYCKATFPAPGGCVIGARPIDLFLSGYEKLGAVVKESETAYEISSSQKLQGTEITFAKISVGATETLMMAASVSEGTTTLHNCALEPEIVNVAEWLNACGASISGAGTPVMTIKGTHGKLLSPKKSFVTIPDRIEAGSYLILGALCAEELVIEKCEPKHMEAAIALLTESGVDIKIGKNSIIVSNKNRNNYKAIANVRTHEYPGFPTDLQSPFVTFLTQTTGESTVLETIFEGRFKYTEELMKMGANITMMNPHEILIKGPTSLKQLPDEEELLAHDIRAGFAVVIAALIGEGKFTIANAHLIDRGYEKLEVRLTALGADIKRV